ncbi:hypothetical protein CDAR_303151 [Caerostris darwini]|uniref:Ycf15 n=1 Tax=Caerostris darwini TaxID=1538125 RepID=A0AAV4V3U2_9ARAC|nr:hypothetical protein CDAR_303151 [Caerostris darwini]
MSFLIFGISPKRNKSNYSLFPGGKKRNSLRMLEILFRIGPETCSGQEKAKSPLPIDRKRTMSSQNNTGFLIDRSTSQRVHWVAPKIQWVFGDFFFLGPEVRRVV